MAIGSQTDGTAEYWLDGVPITRASQTSGFQTYDYWQDGFPISGMEITGRVVKRPTSTVSAGTWTAVGAATLHGALADQSDATYIESYSATDSVRLAFDAMSAPPAGTITFRVRYRRS